MKSTGLRRDFVLLLLTFVLAFPGAAFARPRLERAQLSASGFLEDLLSHAWSLFKGVRNKEGCHIDPNGRCTPGASVETQPSIQMDEGCHIDPNGRCRS